MLLKLVYFKFYRYDLHCVKSVCIRSFYGTYFSSVGLNTDRCSSALRLQSECGKTRTRKTPNTSNFYAVLLMFSFEFLIILFSYVLRVFIENAIVKRKKTTQNEHFYRVISILLFLHFSTLLKSIFFTTTSWVMILTLGISLQNRKK